MDKWWQRLLIAILLAAIFSEAISVVTKDRINLNAFLIGLVLYLILSIIQGVRGRKGKNHNK